MNRKELLSRPELKIGRVRGEEAGVGTTSRDGGVILKKEKRG